MDSPARFLIALAPDRAIATTTDREMTSFGSLTSILEKKLLDCSANAATWVD
jgi:hypothetical protein